MAGCGTSKDGQLIRVMELHRAGLPGTGGGIVLCARPANQVSQGAATQCKPPLASRGNSGSVLPDPLQEIKRRAVDDYRAEFS
jgi:hypothetical protein